MCAVGRARRGRRRAGRLRAAGARGPRAPDDPGRLPPVRRDRGLPRRRRPGRSPRWPTAPSRSRPVDVIVGPGNAWVQEAKRQVAGVVGIDGINGPSELVVVATDGRRSGAARARPAGPGRARAGLAGGRDLAGRGAAARDPRRASSGWRRSARQSPRRRSRWSRPRRGRPRSRWPTSSRPSTSSWRARRPRRWPTACARRAASTSAATARRRSATTSPGSNHVLPTGGAARFASGLGVASFRRRMSRGNVSARRRRAARAGRRGPGPRGGLSRPRRIDGAKSVSSQRPDPPHDQRDRHLAVADARRLGRGHARDRGRLLRPHARRAGAPRRGSTWRCRRTGDLETGAHHTVEDVGLVIGQAIDEALGDRRGIARFGHAVVPMDEARASRGDRHQRAARSRRGRPTCRRSASPASTRGWPRSSSARSRRPRS